MTDETLTAGAAQQMLRERKQAFQRTFGQPSGQRTLASLAQFCYAYETTFDPDPRVDARKQGRRDVWLFVQQHLKLSDDDLYRIATGGILPPEPEEED